MSEPIGGGGRFPLYARVLVGVVAGVLTAWIAGPRVAPLAEVGGLVIRLLKMLATPLVWLAVVDALLRSEIPAKKAGRLVGLSLLNACVAIAIGLLVANVMQGGVAMRGRVATLAAELTPSQRTTSVPTSSPPVAEVSAPPIAEVSALPVAAGPAPSVAVVSAPPVAVVSAPPAAVVSAPPVAAVSAPPVAATSDKPAASLNPLSNLAGYVPESVVEPFLRNNVISVVLLAVAIGTALRRLKDHGDASLRPSIDAIELGIRGLLGAFVQVLTWVVQLLPFAVFGVIAGVVAKTGSRVFLVLGVFLATVLLGLFLHAVVYYAVLLRVAGRMSPVRFYRGAADSIITALSCGSSLASLPVTLRCLDEKLGVSVASSRLAACVGTNLNHDGIILYESAAAIFVAQAFGFDLSIGQQVTIGVTSVMAGIGIAGVPEAGLITLPLVLGAAGLPEGVVATAIPLLLPVDWLIGRCRAATNVTSDMTVAVLLDR